MPTVVYTNRFVFRRRLETRSREKSQFVYIPATLLTNTSVSPKTGDRSATRAFLVVRLLVIEEGWAAIIKAKLQPPQTQDGCSNTTKPSN